MTTILKHATGANMLDITNKVPTSSSSSVVLKVPPPASFLIPQLIEPTQPATIVGKSTPVPAAFKQPPTPERNLVNRTKEMPNLLVNIPKIPNGPSCSQEGSKYSTLASNIKLFIYFR